MATDRAIVSAARGWIGTPYQHQASLRGVGCDCLGLLRGVWRELGGAAPDDIPAYAPDWNVLGAETLRDGLARHLMAVPLAALAAGDIALFRMAPRGPAQHCGIVGLQSGTFTLIHARQNRQVREDVFAPFWRSRLAYLFRV